MAHPYVNDLRARFGLDLDLGLEEGVEMPYEPWLRQMLVRRTHRRYLDQPVSDAIVRLLLASAFAASSKSDFQQASVIWVKDPDRRERLGVLFPDMPWIGTAPVFLVFLGDARRLDRIGELRGHDLNNATLEGFFNAAIDGALALQTCILVAETIGLGTCPISVLRNRIADVEKILELPDKVFPVAGLCLGYPDQPGFVSMRLPLDATVHIDRYDDSRLAAAVDAYDKRRDARFSIRDKQRDPQRFGTAEFYGWSEDKARQATVPDGVGFAAWLKAHGFSLDKP
ncbi:MAG TPA: nitroreductase family protein [Stellaceae bacterium]|jgi:nitroreductase|nr:nitroreductase family protein [Stellaceae bacterium]